MAHLEDVVVVRRGLGAEHVLDVARHVARGEVVEAVPREAQADTIAVLVRAQRNGGPVEECALAGRGVAHGQPFRGDAADAPGRAGRGNRRRGAIGAVRQGAPGGRGAAVAAHLRPRVVVGGRRIVQVAVHEGADDHIRTADMVGVEMTGGEIVDGACVAEVVDVVEDCVAVRVGVARVDEPGDAVGELDERRVAEGDVDMVDNELVRVPGEGVRRSECGEQSREAHQDDPVSH